MSRAVGYASDRDPLLAEVICLPCWQAFPDWREVYGYAVPAELAHPTVCAHCGAEPAEDDVREVAR